MKNSSNQRPEAIRKLADMVQGIRIAMLTTFDEQGNLHSRPMANQKLDFDGDFWFFTDDTAPKSIEIQKESHVNLAFVGHDENRFVSVAGRAQIVHDRAKMEELWSPFYKTWFPQGLDTPHICLIRVRVDYAELWDMRTRAMVSLFEFAKSIKTGQPYRRGANEKLDLTG